MIRQEINLYQERFRDKKLLLSARNGLVLAGLTIVVLLISSFQYGQMKSQQETLQQQNQARKEQATQRLQAIQAELNRLLADERIDQQLAATEQEIRVRKRMIEFIDSNRFGSGVGFSGQLLALSEVKQKNLWLNQIALSGDNVRLAGSALSGQSVPAYFSQFQQRELFEGQVFEIFEVGRQADQDWKVDFVIASKAQTND